MNKIRQATRILQHLLDKGQLNQEEEMELFNAYMDSDVAEVLATFEEELDMTIIRAGKNLYMVPGQDNRVLGFRTKDFKEWMGSGIGLNEIYQGYYIAMVLFSQFYSGKNQNPKIRHFLSVADLLEVLDQRFGAILERDQDQVIVREEELGLNLLSVAENWMSKVRMEGASRTTKQGVVLRVCRLLVKENLILLLEDDREIRTTRKLDDLMKYYFLNDDRVVEINRVFGEGGESHGIDEPHTHS